MRTNWIWATLVAAAAIACGQATRGADCGCAAAAGGCQAGPACGCQSGDPCDPCGGCGGLFGRHKNKGSRYEGLEAGFNCGCNGSYKYPVPPLYTYHWPGMWSAQLMTDYHSPWRFPPLKPYTDEVPPAAMGLDDSAGSLRPVSATFSRPAAEHNTFSRYLEGQ